MAGTIGMDFDTYLSTYPDAYQYNGDIFACPLAIEGINGLGLWSFEDGIVASWEWETDDDPSEFIDRITSWNGNNPYMTYEDDYIWFDGQMETVLTKRVIPCTLWYGQKEDSPISFEYIEEILEATNASTDEFKSFYSQAYGASTTELSEVYLDILNSYKEALGLYAGTDNVDWEDLTNK